MSSGNAAELVHVSVRYGSTAVLQDVSLGVAPGTVVALLGRNGAGKSSLVRCLLGQQRASGGQTLLFGADAWTTRAAAMRRVGVVPEDPDAPPHLTVPQIVALCRSCHARWDDAAVTARLRRFTVPLDVPFGRLSKGQKGAVQLALALGHGPELLVLDDPTLGLDPVARAALYDELIGELAERGTSVFLTTHDLVGVERLADHVAIVGGKGLLLSESLEALRWRCRSIRLSGPAVPDDRAAFLPFEVRRLVRRAWGAELLVTNFEDAFLQNVLGRVGARDAEVVTPPLEDIFLAYVGEVGGVA